MPAIYTHTSVYIYRVFQYYMSAIYTHTSVYICRVFQYYMSAIYTTHISIHI